MNDSPGLDVPGRDAPAPDAALGDSPERGAPRHPSELEIRWHQARSAPPPVVQAILGNLAVAVVGGVLLLAYDWLAARGGAPGGDHRGLAAGIYVAVVVASGSLFTYLRVALPTGASGERRRTPWALLLGLFASIPIVYMSLVVIFELVRPVLG